MTAKIILTIILSMLRKDNASEQRIAEAMNHLTQLSEAIAEGATTDVPATRLIALSYEESRFGLPYKGYKPISGAKACGVFQQIPKWSYVKGTTCAKLNNDLAFATKAAVANLRHITKAFVAKKKNAKDLRPLDERIDDALCHYYSGNECDDAEALAYAKRHRDSRLKAISISKGKAYNKPIKRSVMRASFGLPPSQIDAVCKGCPPLTI